MLAYIQLLIELLILAILAGSVLAVWRYFIFSENKSSLYYSACNVFDKEVLQQFQTNSNGEMSDIILIPEEDMKRLGRGLKQGAKVNLEFYHPERGVLKATVRAWRYSERLKHVQEIGLSQQLRRFFGIEVPANGKVDHNKKTKNHKAHRQWEPASFVTVCWFNRNDDGKAVRLMNTFPNNRSYVRKYLGISLKVTPRFSLNYLRNSVV